MKNLFYIYFFLPISFHLCCNNIIAQKRSEHIVLIFDSIPILERTIKPFPQMDFTSAMPQITVFDNFYKKGYNLRSMVKDTLVISPREEYVVVSFLYSILHAPLEFFLLKGDTIIFTYQNNLPFAVSATKNLNTNLNYEFSRVIANSEIREYTPYEIFLDPTIVAKSINDIVNNRSTIKKNWYEAARGFLVEELSVLSKQTEMSKKMPGMYNFFYDKFIYQLYKLDFDEQKLSIKIFDSILSANKIKPTTNLPYSYFLPFLKSIAEEKIASKVNVLTSGNMRTVDYREVYDKINSWNEINDFYKKHLLYNYLKKIGEIFSTSDLKSYTDKFFLFTKDTILTNNIKNEFINAYGYTASNKESLYIFDSKDNKLSFEEFLKSNKGKVIFIDFWASWCAPCRSEMKNAEKLREEFKTKDVVFAYFSIDKKKSDWIEAYNTERLDKLYNNYILINTNSSNFLKSIKFSSIPRYLLYNRLGQLVHKDAPGPGSKEIRNLLIHYVSDQNTN